MECLCTFSFYLNNLPIEKITMPSYLQITEFANENMKYQRLEKGKKILYSLITEVWVTILTLIFTVYDCTFVPN